MIVVTVLMMSCQVSMSRKRKKVGAHTTTSRTQNEKKRARLAILDDQPAKVSNTPTLADTSLGMRTGPFRFVMASSCPPARPPNPRRPLRARSRLSAVAARETDRVDPSIPAAQDRERGGEHGGRDDHLD